MTTCASPAVASRTPWYRERWPWLLMLGPAIVVVAGFATLWIALRSDDGVVADDYYKRGLAINQTLDRANRGAALVLGGTLDVAVDGNVAATLRARSALPPVVRLRVIHPTRAGLDHAADLVVAVDGVYRGRLDGLSAGRWMIVVETPEWRLGPVETSGDALHVDFAAAAQP
jgi:hypothetical protein